MFTIFSLFSARFPMSRGAHLFQSHLPPGLRFIFRLVPRRFITHLSLSLALSAGILFPRFRRLTLIAPPRCGHLVLAAPRLASGVAPLPPVGGFAPCTAFGSAPSAAAIFLGHFAIWLPPLGGAAAPCCPPGWSGVSASRAAP